MKSAALPAPSLLQRTAPPPPPIAVVRAPPPTRDRLAPGERVDAGGSTYEVESLLGSGAFGDVYKVYNVADKAVKFAMKTEELPKKRTEELAAGKKPIGINKLKMETEVMLEIAKPIHSSVDRSRFIRMIDKGKTTAFKFIIMEVISHSLQDIHCRMNYGRTSKHTWVHIGRETLRSIEALHEIGYLHRDIKPENFAVGLPPNESIVYMLDFGIARRFRELDGRLRVPRREVVFCGTVRFASRAACAKKEQARKDDIEGWIYMMLELYWSHNFAWYEHGMPPVAAVIEKEKIFKKKNALYSEGKLRCPEKFLKIMEMVDRMGYTSQGDFMLMDRLFDGMVEDEKIDEKQPLDWTIKPMPIEEEKVRKDRVLAAYFQLEQERKARENAPIDALVEEAPKKAPPPPPAPARKKKSRASDDKGMRRSSDERSKNKEKTPEKRHRDHRRKRSSSKEEEGSESDRSDRQQQKKEKKERKRRSRSRDSKDSRERESAKTPPTKHRRRSSEQAAEKSSEGPKRRRRSSQDARRKQSTSSSGQGSGGSREEVRERGRKEGSAEQAEAEGKSCYGQSVMEPPSPAEDPQQKLRQLQLRLLQLRNLGRSSPADEGEESSPQPSQLQPLQPQPRGEEREAAAAAAAAAPSISPVSPATPSKEEGEKTTALPVKKDGKSNAKEAAEDKKEEKTQTKEDMEPDERKAEEDKTKEPEE